MVKVTALALRMLIRFGQQHPPPCDAAGSLSCAFFSFFSPRRYRCGFSTTAPSAVMRNILRPTSMPASRPVSGKGRIGTSTHEKHTYQPSASLEMMTVLGVPSMGRDQRIARRPIFDKTK